MDHINAIFIYNNEGLLFDTQHRYLITLRPHAAAIEYQDLMSTNMSESSAFCEDFDDIANFLLTCLSTTLGTRATYDKMFFTPMEYKEWRHSCDFTDNDVAWYVNIEFVDGKIASYLSIDGGAIPAELDQLELLVKEALEAI